MAGTIKGITIEIGGNTTKLQTALAQANKSIRSTQNELRSVERALKLDPGNTTLLADKQRLLGERVEATKTKLEALNKALEKADASGVDKNSQEYKELQTQIHTTEVQLKSLEEETRKFGSVGAQHIAAVGEKVQDVGNGMVNAGETMTKAVTVPLAAAGTLAVKTAADFDSSMSQVKATMGDAADATVKLGGKTQKASEALEELARQMGADTKYSAGQAADAINILAMAGYDAETIYATLPSVLNLAAAGNIEIAEAADYATGIMAGFNLEADQSAHVSDLLAKTASSAKGSVSSFGQGLSTVAGMANSTGQSIEDMSVELGILGNNNISASEAGNELSRMLKNLYQPTDAAKNALTELGVSAFDAEGNARALPDVLNDLNGAVSSMSSEDKMNILGKIFDSATLKNGGLQLIDSAGSSFEELSAKINDCDNAASQMAETQQDNLNGQLDALKSKASEAAISVGKNLIPIISKVVDKIGNLADRFNSLTPAQQKVITTIALLVAAIGPVLVIVGKAIVLIGQVMAWAPFIVAAISAINLPLLAIVGVIAAVIAVGVLLVKHWDDIKAKAGELHDAIQEKFTAIRDGVTEKFNAVRDAMSNAMNAAGNYVKGKLDNIKKAYEENGGGIKGIAAASMEAVKQYYSVGYDAINKITGGKLDDMRNKLKGSMDHMKEVVRGAVAKIKSFFEFDWNLPKIKLPHIKLDGGEAPWGIAGKGRVPSIGVQWYDKGGIFSSPSIIGVGEKRPEFVGALDDLREIVREEAGMASQGEMVSLFKQMLREMSEMNERLDNGVDVNVGKRKFGRMVSEVAV